MGTYEIVYGDREKPSGMKASEFKVYCNCGWLRVREGLINTRNLTQVSVNFDSLVFSFVGKKYPFDIKFISEEDAERALLEVQHAIQYDSKHRGSGE